ncbi:MAG: HEAT repeat domain-containing protein [Candidatus Aminicenantes bacterium]|nr:HEAT repeat domain-containing protein [Candidatus Aminicenantes bacterium]
MKIRALAIVVLALVALGSPIGSQEADELHFREIKLLIFDEKWAEALGRLDDFLARFPSSPSTGQALYYKGKCLDHLAGRERAAMEAYQTYLRRGDKNKSLAESAEIAVIDLALKLAAKGDRSYLPDVVERLESPDKNVRDYAAIQLSYAKERRDAERSIPGLKRILREETNPEVRDRAKIALARLAPKELEEEMEEPAFSRKQMLHFQIVDRRTGKNVFALNIPWILGDLAFSAISADDRASLRAKGYDLDKILKELKSGKGTILEVDDEDSGKTFRIWLK